MPGPRVIKKFVVDKTTVCHPGKTQFVINGRGRDHFCDNAHLRCYCVDGGLR